jgi:Fe-S cluster assembly protein SufD
MEEKPRVVLGSRTRRTEPVAGNFSLLRDMVRLEGPLKDYREKAWNEFMRLPIPTTRDEAWRRTDLRAFPAEAFHLPDPSGRQNHQTIPVNLLKPLAGSQHGGQILLQPDRVVAHLDPILADQGVIFSDLQTAEATHPDLVAQLAGGIVRSEEGKFAALAAAFSGNGILLYVPKGVSIAQPLHSLLWGGADPNLANISHLLIWVDEGASVTYVHEAASPNQVPSLHTGLVEIKVSEGGNLRFVELQSWGDQVWNFTHERAQVDRNANLDWIFGSIGSHMTKNFSNLDLVAPGASGRMSGFYFTNGQQHLDHDTRQNHLAPNTTSDLLFKGALKGNSRCVWQGMIYVAPGAQKTDGYQANRNLILSPAARADSIPGLEILANDVRCTHGATVGKIDLEPMFYLLSRGIPQEDAERLIVEGFFDPIMQRIPFEGVRERFQQSITEKTIGL